MCIQCGWALIGMCRIVHVCTVARVHVLYFPSEQSHHVEVKQNGISDDVMEATPQTPGDYSLQVESSDHVSTEQLEQERGMEEFGGGELQEVESKGVGMCEWGGGGG